MDGRFGWKTWPSVWQMKTWPSLWHSAFSIYSFIHSFMKLSLVRHFHLNTTIFKSFFGKLWWFHPLFYPYFLVCMYPLSKSSKTLAKTHPNFFGWVPASNRISSTGFLFHWYFLIRADLECPAETYVFSTFQLLDTYGSKLVRLPLELVRKSYVWSATTIESLCKL